MRKYTKEEKNENLLKRLREIDKEIFEAGSRFISSSLTVRNNEASTVCEYFFKEYEHITISVTVDEKFWRTITLHF